MTKIINGWTITGTEDLSLLENDPSLFQATKGDWTLTIYKRNLVESLVATASPDAQIKHNVNQPGVFDWRLVWNKEYDVSRGRSLDQIMKKSVQFMEYK